MLCLPLGFSFRTKAIISPAARTVGIALLRGNYLWSGAAASLTPTYFFFLGQLIINDMSHEIIVHVGREKVNDTSLPEIGMALKNHASSRAPHGLSRSTETAL